MRVNFRNFHTVWKWQTYISMRSWPFIRIELISIQNILHMEGQLEYTLHMEGQLEYTSFETYSSTKSSFLPKCLWRKTALILQVFIIRGTWLIRNAITLKNFREINSSLTYLHSSLVKKLIRQKTCWFFRRNCDRDLGRYETFLPSGSIHPLG